VAHRITARRSDDAGPPLIETDPAIVASFLSDAAHVAGGFAAGVAFPRSEGEVAALVARTTRVLAVGAQSSLTGGATPRGEVVLSTRALATIAPPDSRTVRAGAGVPLLELQRVLRGRGLYYPPVPTYEGAFVGGTIATNAAGAATFKYGSTRAWVEAITVVLASGDVLDISRGDTTADDSAGVDVVATSGRTLHVPLPAYAMPPVAKLSAGYFAAPAMDLIDLFIGSEGTLGVITAATLRVIRRPRRWLALIRCAGDGQALALTAALRRQAGEAWHGRGPLDIAAVEYMDARAVGAVPDESFRRARVARPGGEAALLLIQIENGGEDAAAQADAALERLQAVLSSCGVSCDPVLSAPEDERGAERLLELREAVPASVNALVAAARAVHPEIEKTAGDMVVPFDRLEESLALYRHAFASRGLDHAIWGHASDGNLHPNVVPRTFDDVARGREALLEIARGVMAMGGAPLAEHGVGRSALKQRLLRELYGEDGIAQMRAVKRALDPGWKLSPGVLFQP
jgi:D-lactate dehydrogenase (cytochrome)